MNRRSFLHSSGALALPAAASTASETPRIRAGQIGTLHSHAAGQLATLRECGEYELVGVVAENEARQRELADHPAYQGVEWMSEAELLAFEGLEVVAVETQIEDLLRAAQAVADAGLHLHLDKPAGEDLNAFAKVVETLRERDRLLKMGYMFRFNPAFQLAQKAVTEGWLGEIHTIHGELNKKVSGPGRKELLAYEGGAMFELGCHLVEAVLRLLGVPDSIQSESRAGGDGLADNMVAILNYEQALVTLRCSLREVGGGARRQLVVAGNLGTLEILPLEPPKVRLTLEEAVGGFQRGAQQVDLEPQPRYLADWVAFATAVRGETPWPFSLDHDLETQRAVLLASGIPVDSSGAGRFSP